MRHIVPLLGYTLALKPEGFNGTADRSRMSREAHVRISGGLEVKSLRSTRPTISASHILGSIPIPPRGI